MPSGRPEAWRDDAALRTALGWALVAGLFLACHPYAGLRGDSALYLLRSLADLDSTRLGRDMLIVDDGQMRFSLFPWLLRPLVSSLGAAKAAMVVAALGDAAWFAALTMLARRIAGGGTAEDRLALAMVAMVAVLPAGYGGADGTIFAYAETAATPRPFAEALVMVAFASLLAGRRIVCLAALALAVLIHPIMAAAGVVAIALVMLWQARRALRLPALAPAALAGGALMLFVVGPSVPWLDRPDSEWLTLLRGHSPHLFLTSWTAGSWVILAAQAATIAVAANRLEGPQRTLFVAAAATCAAGLALSLVLGDAIPLLAVVQVQPWRAAWIVAVLGGCALAISTARLGPDRPRGRIVLALLWLAWFFQPAPLFTLAVGGLALWIELGGRRLALAPRHAALAWGVAAILTLVWASGAFLGWIEMLRGLAPGQQASTIDPLRNNLQSLPLCALIAVWLVREGRPLRAVTLAATGAVLAAFAVLAWDQRGPGKAYLETSRAPSGLAALAADRSPDVLWIGDMSDAWFALGRPQYFSEQQGSAMVFSRRLALGWARRAEALAELGLVPRNVLAPWQPASQDLHVSEAGLDVLCKQADAPGLVIAPLDATVPIRPGAVVWTLPAPIFSAGRRTDRLAILPCGAQAGVPR